MTSHFSLFTSHFKVKRGFTLIELLIVISIIAILVASATASWRNAQMKGRDGKRKTDLKSIQQALENYMQTNGKYPSETSGQIKCNAGSDTTTITWGNALTCNSLTFMQQLPKDPVYQSTTGYYYNNTGTNTYILSVLLENTNDPDLTGLPCTPRASRNYCVTNP